MCLGVGLAKGKQVGPTSKAGQFKRRRWRLIVNTGKIERRTGGERMRERAKLNAIRSGIVIIGSLAFGYLTLEIGFKPFLQKAQEEEQNIRLQPDFSLCPEQQEEPSSYRS